VGKSKMSDQVRHDGKEEKPRKWGLTILLTSVPFFAKTGILTRSLSGWREGSKDRDAGSGPAWREGGKGGILARNMPEWR